MFKKTVTVIVLSLHLFISCGAWNIGEFVINSKLPEKCGWLPNYSSEFEFVSRTNWPWIGTLSYDNFDLKKCICILIHPEVVLTGSLCIGDIRSYFDQELRAGFSMRGLQSYQNITVAKIHFSQDDDVDGIALLKLKRPVEINAAVHPICLWEENYDYLTQFFSHTALMTGTDLTENADSSTVLQLPIQISEKIMCEESNNSMVDDICVTYGKELQICHYIGSTMILPRLSNNGTIIWYLRGILTQRLKNCGKNHYRIKDLAPLRIWIESHFKASIESSCGRRVINHVPLIIKGEKTERGDYPWHLALYVHPEEGTKDELEVPQYYGGASLISERFAITAGHCIATDSLIFSPERITLAMGKFDLSKKESGTLIAKVSKVILHEKFSFTTLQNDIALLKFKNDVIYNHFVQPICMWDDTNTDKKKVFEKLGKVVGWGKNEHGEISRFLTSATVQIQNDNDCRRTDGEFYKIYLTDTTLCAGNPEKIGTNVCNGDSGGGLILPILQGDRHISWYLRGIVSVSKSKSNEKICDSKYNVIYTDVAQYIKWINKMIKENS